MIISLSEVNSRRLYGKFMPLSSACWDTLQLFLVMDCAGQQQLYQKTKIPCSLRETAFKTGETTAMRSKLQNEAGLYKYVVF